MIPNVPTIGVRFDIQKVGGGYYGAACWMVFWEAISSEELQGAVLYEGDTAATLNGRENVFCLAVQSMDPSVIEKIRNALSKSEAFQKVCASPMFSEGSACSSEPLPDAGKIDATGNLVGDSMAARSSLGNVKRKRKAAVETDHVTNVPKLERPASDRTRSLTKFSSFADVVTFLKNNFTPKEWKYSYWLSAEELCDVVDASSEVAEVHYDEYSCGRSEDMCCIILFQKTPPEGRPIEFHGLFSFASESDAREFVREYKSAQAYMKVLPQLAGISGRIQVNFEGEEGNSRDITYKKEKEISPSDLWPKLWARKQGFSKEIEEGKRQVEEQRRRDEEEQKRREEEAKRMEQGRKRRQEEDARKKAEEERLAKVQAGRKSSGQCVMCGNALGFFQRLLGKDRHGQCTEFKE